MPVSGAISQQRNVETIANNVANINTPGFKKDQMVFREYLSAYEKGTDIDLPDKEWSPEDFYRTYGAEKAQVKADAVYTKYSQGQLTPTQNPFDLAINGQGFFEILTPNGIRYSRKGTFSLSSEGVLVTNEGYPVLAKLQERVIANEALPIGPGSRKVSIPRGKVHINQEGEISVNGNTVNRLSIVEFNDIHKLTKEGNGFFINNSENNISKNVLKSKVHQGFVEKSNVNAVEEMSELIKAHRQFENLQRVIKVYDSMAEKAYNEIARF